MDIDIASLRGILTQEDPLGPIDQANISDASAESLLDSKVVPFKNVTDEPRLLLLGRKGSGKSAILTEVQLNLDTINMRDQVIDCLPERGESFVIKMDSWELFLEITEEVWKRSRARELPEEYIPPEYYTNLWYDALWEEIFLCFSDCSNLNKRPA